MTRVVWSSEAAVTVYFRSTMTVLTESMVVDGVDVVYAPF